MTVKDSSDAEGTLTRDLSEDETAAALAACFYLENVVEAILEHRVDVPFEIGTLETAGRTIMQGLRDSQKASTVGAAMGFHFVARLYREGLVPRSFDLATTGGGRG